MAEIRTMRVAGGTEPGSLAGSITQTLLEHGEVESRAVGAAAVNQAVKGVILARSMLAAQGFDLMMKPRFGTYESRDGEMMTLIIFHLELVERA